MINIKQALQYACEQLSGFQDAKREADYLLAAVIKRDRAFLISHPEYQLTQHEDQLFHQALQRRQQGEPLAYIAGSKGFWNLDLAVTQDVLIPRPETELLVEQALELFSAKEQITVVDLGTGSGAIALAIASERPHWQVWATDVSAAALKQAEQNAEQLNINNVQFVQGDWLQAVTDKQFHLIVSNPPYIAADDPELENAVAKYEPSSAIVAADNGLACIKTIASNARHCLYEKGYVLLEHGYRQAEAVKTILAAADFDHINTVNDLAGLTRVTMGQVS